MLPCCFMPLEPPLFGEALDEEDDAAESAAAGRAKSAGTRVFAYFVLLNRMASNLLQLRTLLYCELTSLGIVPHDRPSSRPYSSCIRLHSLSAAASAAVLELLLLLLLLPLLSLLML